MLTQYKNALYEVIRSSQIHPSLFDWKILNYTPSQNLSVVRKIAQVLLNKDAVRIRHDFHTIMLKNSTYIFVILVNPKSHHEFSCTYRLLAPDFALSPRNPEFEESRWQPRVRQAGDQKILLTTYINMERLKSVLKEWLEGHVKPYVNHLNSQDLWRRSGFVRNIVDVDVIKKRDTSAFSEQEIEAINLVLDRFLIAIKEKYHPTKEQTREIKDLLLYLSEATQRLNRFDWQGLVISTMVGISINLSIDTEMGAELYTLLQDTFLSIQHLLNSPPAI